MLTGLAREQLKHILEFSAWKDLKIMELKIVPGTPQSESKSEMIEAILACASQPSKVLRQQRLRKAVMLRYLWQCGIPVTQEQSKSDYIRILLDTWKVKDDEYLWRFRTDEEIEAEINQFQETMAASLQELMLRIRERRPSPRELRLMKKSMDKFLQTIVSIGKVASPQVANSGSPPSDDDSESSSSSTSSVEILECPPDTVAALSQCSSDMQNDKSPQPERHSNEPSSSQQGSPTNTSEPLLPQMSSVDEVSSSSQPSPFDNILESSPSPEIVMDISESVAQVSATPLRVNKASISPSKHLTHSKSRSLSSNRIIGGSSSKKLFGTDARPGPNFNDFKDLIQTEISKYFKQARKSKHKHSS